MSIWSDQKIKELLERVAKLEAEMAELRPSTDIPRKTLTLNAPASAKETARDARRAQS